MAADEHDLDGRKFRPQLLGQCNAIHIGCNHVSDHQVHLIFPDVVIGLGAVRKFRFNADAVLCPVEMLPQTAPDSFFVVDDDGFVHDLPPVIRP